jgi:hypothetical protein
MRSWMFPFLQASSLWGLDAMRPALALVALAWGCVQYGDVRVTVDGEEFAEEGIPAEEMADGWSIVFDHFEVDVRRVVVGGQGLGDGQVIDVAEASDGNGHDLVRGVVRAGDHDGPGFEIHQVDLRGTATRDETVKTFAWTFDAVTQYMDCETTTVVRKGREARLEITIHVDHLFVDSLVAEAPDLRFDLLAQADTNDDGVIARAELEAADIGAYDPGSASGIETLWAWLSEQARRVGHVDGEGHCHRH